jgi:hypothetical protein
MVRACREFDVDLKKVPMPNGCTSGHQYELIRQYKNAIAWCCPAVPEEVQKKQCNILFFENALLNTADCFYLDDHGYGVNSNIVALGFNRRKNPPSNIQETREYLSKLGWPMDHGFARQGHILIALQAKTIEDRELLQKCEDFLPLNARVVVRPHPGNVLAERTQIYEEFCLRNHWSIDTVASPFESLKGTRALVTNFSSLLFKALAMSIPVAACMRGFHSGTSAVLDCSRNPEMLKHILHYKFDREASDNLLHAVQSESLSRTASVEEVLRNTNFANWLARIRIH